MGKKRSSRVLLLLVLMASMAAVLVWVLPPQSRQNKLRAEGKRKEAVLQLADTLGHALRQYTTDYDMSLPLAQNWEQALRSYLPPEFSFTLPAPDGQAARRFAFNKVYAGRKVGDLWPPVWERIVFFESMATTPSAADEITSLPPADEAYGFVVIYADGVPEYIAPAKRETFMTGLPLSRKLLDEPKK